VENDELTSPTIHEGDINARGIGITFETASAILAVGGKSAGDALALYCFYCFTARRQSRGQVIHATVGYTAVGLKWTKDRVRRARQVLKELGLVDDHVVYDAGHRVVQHRVKVRFLLSRSTLTDFQRVEIPECGKSVCNKDDQNEKRLSNKTSFVVTGAIAWSATEGWSGVSDELRSELHEAYPACDLDRQLRQMTLWLKSNPQRAKKSNWLRFINNWLKKEQDRGGDLRGKSTSKPPAMSYRTRQDKINELNRRKQQLQRANAPYWKIHEIDIQLSKL